jgi:precorrin-6A/cobalt-precorrin-6A reductase
MKVLLLGGTSDARHMADCLHKNGVSVVYSIAGLVRLPTLSCEVVSGGFSQFGGLNSYLQEQGIAAILDMTHPYAVKISDTAREVATGCCIPYWHFSRPAWQAMAGDQWHDVSDWGELLPKLVDKKVIFLSAGQMRRELLNEIVAIPTVDKVILRTAVKPSFKLPESIEWIKAIGPFEFESELQLFEQYGVDVLVSKNSGGKAVLAKIHVARQLGVPVLMLSRPIKHLADKNFIDESSCGDFVIAQCAARSNK